jgi:LEA14-like dessication related protein
MASPLARLSFPGAGLPRYALTTLLLGLLAGCAGLAPRPEPPTLALSGLSGVELRASDAKLTFRFEVGNPNDLELEVQSLEFDVALEGVNVANGRSPRAFMLPRKGTSQVDIDVSTSFEKLAAASRAALERRGNSVRYEIVGKATVGDRAVPFRRAGETPLPTPRSLGLR